MVPLKPDVLVVQEAESFDDILLFAGDHQPTFRHRAKCDESNRGLATLSYTDARIACVDSADPLGGFGRFEVMVDGHAFNVVAGWTWETRDQSNYRHIHIGLERYATWIEQRPTFLLGDFNDNASYAGGRRWQQLIALTERLGLVSAYHHHFKEAFGSETQPTHYSYGHKDKAFHLDYCFLPDAMAKRITSVAVGTYDEWHSASDHMPLLVDLDVSGLLPI